MRTATLTSLLVPLAVALSACGSSNGGSGGGLSLFGGGAGGAASATKGGSGGSEPFENGGSAGAGEAGSDNGGAGKGGSSAGKGGSSAGGSDPGEEAQVEDVLFHVSCLTSLGGDDPTKVFRFAGSISKDAGGKRTVQLQALRVQAETLSDTVGAEYTGQTPKGAVDGDAVSFGEITIVPEANPISGSLAIIDDTELHMVLAGSKNRPCAELEGKLVKPLVYSFSDPSSVDTCVFDPVESKTATLELVTDVSRFAPCEP